MTVWKAFNIRRRNGGPNSRLIQTFLREGPFCSAAGWYIRSQNLFTRCLLLYLDFHRKFGRCSGIVLFSRSLTQLVSPDQWHILSAVRRYLGYYHCI